MFPNEMSRAQAANFANQNDLLPTDNFIRGQQSLPLIHFSCRNICTPLDMPSRISEPEACRRRARGPQSTPVLRVLGCRGKERLRCSIRNHNKQIVAQLGMTNLSK